MHLDIINRKKKVFVFVIFLIVIIFLGMYITDRIRMKNNKPVIFSKWGYSYAPPIDLKEEEIKNAIIDYIVNKGDNEYKHNENEKTFVSMRIYLIEEKERQVIYNVYAWVLEEKYFLENNEIKQDSGTSIPCKFVVENVEGKYSVTNWSIPRDGSYYAKDIKNIFPSSVVNDMDKIQEDGTLERLELDIQNQKDTYFKK